MLALAEKTKTVPMAIKTTTTIAMQSATGLSLDAVIIKIGCTQIKRRLFPAAQISLLNCIFGFLRLITIKILLPGKAANNPEV